jgi:hypothetical protein
VRREWQEWRRGVALCSGIGVEGEGAWRTREERLSQEEMGDVEGVVAVEEAAERAPKVSQEPERDGALALLDITEEVAGEDEEAEAEQATQRGVSEPRREGVRSRSFSLVLPLACVRAVCSHWMTLRRLLRRSE